MGTHREGGTVEQFSLFVTMERNRHAKRLRVPALMAALIAVLLYQTQWFILRPGLALLFAGQAGVVIALVLRNVQLTNDLGQKQTIVMGEEFFSGWFEREELFVKWLGLFESGCQVIGFVALGYGVWSFTRSLWLALAIGVVYPISTYLGMTRRRNLTLIRELRTEKERLSVQRANS